MKRIISLLLIMFIMLSSMTVFAENSTEAILEKIATLTKEEREQYISLARPFFTSDAGVSAALDNINAGVFSSMFGDLFGETAEKDYLKRLFLSVKCIKEETGIRLKYADIIQEKIPMAISSETKQGIGVLLEHTYKKSPCAIKPQGRFFQSVHLMICFPRKFGKAAADTGVLLSVPCGDFHFPKLYSGHGLFPAGNRCRLYGDDRPCGRVLLCAGLRL